MKRVNVSNNVIRRLPRYLDRLRELMDQGVERISSAELGRQMNLTPSQIRQDFSCFGEFGQQGYGYNVALLRAEISSILGMDRQYSIVVIGVGNLGHALMKNFGFAAHGFRLLAAFDILPELVGTWLGGVPIHHISALADFVRQNPVDIAVLTIPQEAAVPLVGQLASLGVKGVWNFTSEDLHLVDEPLLVENIRFSDSLLSLSYRLNERDEDAEEAAREGCS